MGGVEREAEKRQRTFILNFAKFIVIIFSRSMFGSATDQLLVLCTQLLSYRPGLGSGLSKCCCTYLFFVYVYLSPWSPCGIYGYSVSLSLLGGGVNFEYTFYKNFFIRT